ncbi:MAG: hypothetical protein H8E79_09625 [Desulfobulbaceae bacterium]|uniref:Cytochrome c7-like domain-containing protein n=1 Tax=Candidatus Desulfatifera sulfidica TaxID=2841691 RepID=A0A8J6TEM6_9BACT|nr:hypothetical protein [Candidatus Desulfatifera sulfidica]
MINNKIITFATVLLAGSFFLTGNGHAEEAYDVQAYGPKTTIIFNTPVTASFDHKVHTADIGLDCSSCHDSEMVAEKRGFAMQRGVAEATGQFTMAAMAEGQFCGVCHDGDMAFGVDENCAACHQLPDDPIIWTAPVKAVIFSHDQHVNDIGLDCESCHSDVFAMKVGAAPATGNYTMRALNDGQYCGACHDGETAFASNTQCNTCHIGVKGYNRAMGTTPDTGGH